MNEAIILAGGLGTRLRSVVEERPKSMALINEKPFLEYLFDFLITQGINRFILSVGYKSTFITAHFKNEYKGCEIEYVTEDEPLGTGGAIKKAIEAVKGENVLITNGDSLFLGDIKAQLKFHLEQNAHATLGLKPMQNFDRYGVVLTDENGRINAFQEKQPTVSGTINSGVYIFKRSIFEGVELPLKFSIEKDFFEKYIQEFPFFGFVNDGYFLDIGIPEDYNKAQDEFAKLNY